MKIQVPVNPMVASRKAWLARASFGSDVFVSDLFGFHFESIVIIRRVNDPAINSCVLLTLCSLSESTDFGASPRYLQGDWVHIKRRVVTWNVL